MGGMDHSSSAPVSPSGSDSTGSSSDSAAAHAVHPADVMFVTMMIPHHEQAVQMSDLLLAKSGVDPDVRKLAQQIKAAQQPEIERMQGWMTDWGIDDSDMGGMDHSDHMGGMLTAEQLDALKKANGPEGQKLFLEGMIQHHEGAITMANNVLSGGQDPQVKTLAETIVTTQQAEITEMEKLLGR